jgi:hypothetical protein
VSEYTKLDKPPKLEKQVNHQETKTKRKHQRVKEKNQLKQHFKLHQEPNTMGQWTKPTVGCLLHQREEVQKTRKKPKRPRSKAPKESPRIKGLQTPTEDFFHYPLIIRTSWARVYAKKIKNNQYHEENWILSTNSLSSKGLPENKIALRVVQIYN